MSAKSSNERAAGSGKQPGSQSDFVMWILYALIVIAVISYAVYGSALIGVFAFLLIVITLVAEFRGSVKQSGMRSSIYEIMMALVGVVVLWIILSVALNTTSPLNVVASCSMLPNLHRGDLIVLNGISNMSYFLSSHNVPTVNVSQQEFNGMMSSISDEFLAYYFYSPSDPSQLAEITNQSSVPVGLYNSICLSKYAYLDLPQDNRMCMAGENGQASNLVKYSPAVDKLSINGTYSNIASISSISIANQTIVENYSNPIIVYKTTPNDSFSGDIIHRLYAAMRVGSSYYLLTKGDNNPGIDMEFGNYPINQSDVVGYVVADIPMAGYLKLILTGQLATPAGCNYVILR